MENNIEAIKYFVKRYPLLYNSLKSTFMKDDILESFLHKFKTVNLINNSSLEGVTDPLSVFASILDRAYPSIFQNKEPIINYVVYYCKESEEVRLYKGYIYCSRVSNHCNQYNFCDECGRLIDTFYGRIFAFNDKDSAFKFAKFMTAYIKTAEPNALISIKFGGATYVEEEKPEQTQD